MARAVASIDNYRGSDEGFRPWLFGILRHVIGDTCRLRLRGAHRRMVSDLAALPDLDDRLVTADEHASVRSAFARLDPDEQRLLELRVLGGLSSQEVATLLGMRAGAVRMAQARALGRMRMFMEESPRWRRVGGRRPLPMVVGAAAAALLSSTAGVAAAADGVVEPMRAPIRLAQTVAHDIGLPVSDPSIGDVHSTLQAVDAANTHHDPKRVVKEIGKLRAELRRLNGDDRSAMMRQIATKSPTIASQLSNGPAPIPPGGTASGPTTGTTVPGDAGSKTNGSKKLPADPPTTVPDGKTLPTDPSTTTPDTTPSTDPSATLPPDTTPSTDPSTPTPPSTSPPPTDSTTTLPPDTSTTTTPPPDTTTSSIP